MATNYTVQNYDATPDYKKQYEAAVGQVKNSYDQQRNSLNEQAANMPYTYQQDRNRLSNQGYQTRQALDEVSAQRGLYRSGQARTDLANARNNTNSAINESYNNQQQAAQQLSNRLNELNAGEATAISALQGQEGQAQRSYDLQQAALTGMLGGNPTLAKQQYDRDWQVQQAGLTGNFNGQKTVQQQSQNLALLNALLGYAGTIGQNTGSMPTFNNFYPGDYLTTLLKGAYTA